MVSVKFPLQHVTIHCFRELGVDLQDPRALGWGPLMFSPGLASEEGDTQEVLPEWEASISPPTPPETQLCIPYSGTTQNQTTLI